MVNVRKIVKRGGSMISDGAGLLKKTLRKSLKFGAKALSKTVELATDSLKKIKNKAKKLSKNQITALLLVGAGTTYAGVNLGDAISEHNKRNNKTFIVTEVFYKEGDEVDEISFVILNPERIEIYVDDQFVINSTDSIYNSKIQNKTIELNTLPYTITETKISKDKDNDEQPSDKNPDIPFVITIRVLGLNMTGKDKDMIKSGNNLFTLQLKADLNNSIKDEYDDDGQAVKEAVKEAVDVVANVTGDIFEKLFGPIGKIVFWCIIGLLIMTVIGTIIYLFVKKK